MAWATFRHTLKEVDRAGLVLADPAAPPNALEDAEAVVDNWRRAHSFALNCFQMTLRKRARRISTKSEVAQRLKRMQSIRFKLQTNDKLRDHLSAMQDIGGCRVILTSPDLVWALVGQYRMGCGDHVLEREDDYITNPKRSGYRGVHHIYRYKGTMRQHRGRRVEIQFRTHVQHLWATAVETASTYTGMPLKSNRGDRQWRRFFACMGSAIAIAEGLPPVPGVPADEKGLLQSIAEYQERLDVIGRLEAYRLAGEVIQKQERGAKFFVLELDIDTRRLVVTPFLNQADASEFTSTAEKKMAANPNLDVVQVKVESVKALRRAYPNYFADTVKFVDMVKRLLAAGEIEPAKNVRDGRTASTSDRTGRAEGR